MDGLRFTTLPGWKAACWVGSRLKPSCTVLKGAFTSAVDWESMFQKSALCSLQVWCGPDLLQAGEV